MITSEAKRALRPQRQRDFALAGATLAAALAIALLPLELAAALLALPPLAALCLSYPVWALYLLVLSVPLQEHVQLPMGLTVTQLLAGLALLSWILRMLVYRTARLPRPLLLAWSIHLTALMLAAAAADYSVDQSIKELGRWLAALLAFELTASQLTTRRRAWGLVACLLLAGLAAAALGLWQFWTATGHESFRVGRFVRAYGPFGKPNPLAGYLNMAWPLAVAASVGLLVPVVRRVRQGLARAPRISWLHYAAAVGCSASALLLLAGEAATYSRGGWLGAAAALTTMAALASGRLSPRLLVGALLAGGLLLGLAVGASEILPTTIAGRVQSITNNLRLFDAAKAEVNDANFAIVERMAHWQAGAYMFLSEPLLGVGPGNFYLAYPDYFVGRWNVSQGHAHNYYIHIAAEAGLVGLLAYLILIVAAARQGLRAVRRADTIAMRSVAVGGCGIIAAVAMHNVFENLHVLNMGIQLSAVWGLLVWIAGRQDQRQEESII